MKLNFLETMKELRKIQISTCALAALFIGTLTIICLPYFITIFFSTPCSDDFAMAKQTLCYGENVLLSAWNVSIDSWLSHGGGIPFNFLQCLLNPIVLFGATSYFYGFFLVCVFFAFIVVLYCFFRTIFKYWLYVASVRKINIYFCIFIFCFLNTCIYTEIFYWFVGNSYLWELEFALINQILIVLFFRKKQSFWFGAVLSIFGFISCFGYQVALYTGIVFLYELIVAMRKKKFNWYLLLPLVFMLFGGCISLFAPGNFARYGTENAVSSGVIGSAGPDEIMKENMSTIKLSALFTAFITTVENNYKSVIDLLANPFCIILFLVSFCYGWFYKKSINFNKLIFWGFAIIIMIFLTIFPVSLGYGRSDFPNRVLFYINFGILCYTSILLIYIGSFVFQKFKIKRKWIKIFAVFSSLLFVFSVCGYIDQNKLIIYQYPYFHTASNIINCKNDRNGVIKTIKSIQNSEQDNVVLNYNNSFVLKSNSKLINPLYIDVDSNHWANKATAYCLGKESVRIE